MKQLTAISKAQIARKTVALRYELLLDPDGTANDLTADVRDYSWEMDVMSQGSATITLANTETSIGSGYKKYSPEAVAAGAVPIKTGMKMKIREGVGTDMFNKFFGVVRQVIPSIQQGDSVIEITLLDPLCLLNELDWNYSHEAAVTSPAKERLEPDDTDDGEHFYATISGTVTTTTVPYTGETGEKYLSADANTGMNVLYNFTRKTCRTIVSYNASTNKITTAAAIDSWASIDKISNKFWFSIFNLAHTDIKSNSLTVNLRPLWGSVINETPLYSGFGVNNQDGQITMNSAIDAGKFGVWGTYQYYAVGLNVEDIVETIVTAVDAYGKYPFVAADILTYFQTEEGSGVQDSLQNTATNTWHTTYDNIQTTMDFLDFSIVGGGSYVAFTKKTGELITTGTVTSVTCTTNYQFKTLQSSGITVPYFKVSDQTTGTRFDAISELLKTVAPNYRVWVAGNGKLWARYLSQKLIADDTAGVAYSNLEQVSFYPDDTIYTRVKLMAKNLTPSNALVDATLVQEALGIGYATDDVCTYLGTANGYRSFSFVAVVGSRQRSIPGVIMSTPYPVVLVNGNPMRISGGLKTFYDNSPSNLFLFEISEYTGTDPARKQIIRLPDVNLSNPVKFYDMYDVDITDRYFFIPDFNLGELYFYSYYPLLTDIVKITAYGAESNTDYSTDYIVDFNEYMVKVREDAVKTTDKVTISYWYFYGSCGTYVISTRKEDMLDVSSISTAEWAWTNDPFFASPGSSFGGAYGAVLFVSSWNELKEIQGIRITAGAFHPARYSFTLETSGAFLCNFNLTVKYSAACIFTANLVTSNYASGFMPVTETTIYTYNCKNISSLSSSGYIWIDSEKISYSSFYEGTGNIVTFYGCVRGQSGGSSAVIHFEASTSSVPTIRSEATFSEICEALTNVAFTSGDTIDFDKAAFGEDFFAGAIMCILESTESIVFNSVTVWPASIAEFRVESDRYITAVASLVDVGTPETDVTVHDHLGLRTLLGERLCKLPMEDNKLLYKEDYLRALAKNYLKEFTKNHTRVGINEMCNPSWVIGMTLRIVDSQNAIDRRYFAEKIKSSNGRLSLELSYFP